MCLINKNVFTYVHEKGINHLSNIYVNKMTLLLDFSLLFYFQMHVSCFNGRCIKLSNLFHECLLNGPLLSKTQHRYYWLPVSFICIFLSAFQACLPLNVHFSYFVISSTASVLLPARMSYCVPGSWASSTTSTYSTSFYLVEKQHNLNSSNLKLLFILLFFLVLFILIT